jgi:hypothetical protein
MQKIFREEYVIIKNELRANNYAGMKITYKEVENKN